MTEKQRILIIDDDPFLRKTLSDILRTKGYDALAAKDGAEGLDLLQQNRINVALIDLRLPDASGLEVLGRAKSACPSVEAIILTGHADLDSAIEATNSRAFSYLRKPVEIDELVLHIRRALEKQQFEEDREKLIAELREALAKIKTLSGLLPICSYCKKIKDDKGYWNRLEDYITEHSDALLSHGLCPECARRAHEPFERFKRETGRG